jgi:pimeloyl-ACP methyl ester carboxylesterase
MRGCRPLLLNLLGVILAPALGAWSSVAAAEVVRPPAATAVTTPTPVQLPRKAMSSGHRDESYPGVVVSYDAIRDTKGQRLRLILTHPQAGGPRFPTIFVVGWLSCDSVEAPPGTEDPTQRVFQAIARMPGFATARLDKAGVGDSDGDCAATDFLTELDGYRQAFRYLQMLPYVDNSHLFLFGISNGGGFAPLVAQTTPVMGYVVDGGWIKSWYEHMLEIERRRLGLAGTAPAEINPSMQAVAQLYSAYLLERQAPAEILSKHPEMRSLWEGDAQHQYGRSVAYYQQLQDLNLMAAWSQVRVPVLALHGEFDWIMSREDPQILVSLVNRNTPGAAVFVELPAAGHSFEHYLTQQAAFAGDQAPFDVAVAERVVAWFEAHR